MGTVVELKAVNGVRNDVPEDRFTSGDLAVGTNIDIDETGKAYRRLGTQLLVSGNCHSLWSNNSTGAYVVVDGTLKQIDEAGVLHAIKSVAGRRVSYVAINNNAYWTDGLTTGILNKATNVKWGIVPPTQPSVSLTFGDLLEGTYLITTVFVTSTGVESGAPACVAVYADANEALVLTNISVSNDPAVTKVRVYVTPVNGEVPMQVAELANGVTTTTIRAMPTLGQALRTQFMGPPPAGQLVGYYNGRAYIASGNALYYSQPYEFGLFDLAYGYILFDSPIQTFAAVNDGIYIGTTLDTVFISGNGPESFVRTVVSPYGTVLGTEYYVRNDILLEGNVQGMSPVWMSTKGLVLGADSGKITALTSEKYQLPPATEGASLMKIRSATPQFVTTIFN